MSSLVTPELTAKRLELLRLFAGRRAVSSSGEFHQSDHGAASGKTAQEAVRRTLGVQLLPLDAHNASELDAALARTPQSGAAVVSSCRSDSCFWGPAAEDCSDPAPRRGCLHIPGYGVPRCRRPHDYGPSPKQAMRRVAVYVDKILRAPNRPICPSSRSRRSSW